MKTTARFKSHSLLTLFLFMSFATSNAQDYFNYNTVTESTPNGIVNKEKIDTILNSDSILLSSADMSSRASSPLTSGNVINTLEINYSNLSEVTSVSNQNIKNCIVKITAPVSSINLNALNHFMHLEVIHVIIETPLITGNIRDLIVMTNPQVLISYQISILQ